MTPYELEMCLWYYCRGEDWPYSNELAKATIDKFIKSGLLTFEAGMLYKPTDKLNAFVEHLQNQPLPIQRWVIP